MDRIRLFRTPEEVFREMRRQEEESENEGGQENLTLVGTLRKNKPQIPPSMLAKLPIMSTKFLYQYDKLLLSHSPKKT